MRAAHGLAQHVVEPFNEGWHYVGKVRVDGTPLHPDRFTRSFTERVRQLALPKIRLHDLRHAGRRWHWRPGFIPRSCRSGSGTPNISITLDGYSHVTASLHGDAAEKVAGIVFGAR